MVRKYSVNEDYFTKWSEDMAYILGLLYADGNMDSDTYSVDLVLKEADKEHLLKVTRCISKDLPIKRDIFLLRGKKFIAYGMHLYRRKMYRDLIKLGLCPNKSFTIKFPKISDKYLNHFIRGVFDGDGSVTKDGDTGVFCITSGSKEFAYSLFDVFTNVVRIEGGSVYHLKGDSIYDVNVYRKSDFRKLYNFLYCNANLYLERKESKFREIINNFRGD